MIAKGAPETDARLVDLSRPPRAAIDARGAAPWRVVGGIPLAVRLVRSLELEGFREIRVLCDRPLETADLGSRRPDVRATPILLSAEEPAAGLLADLAGGDRLLVVDGALLADRRLLRALASLGTPARVAPPEDETRTLLAVVSARSAAAFATEPTPCDALALLEVATVSTDAPEMRGPMPILYRAVRSDAGASHADDELVRGTQKHVMDAPARWIDPFFENAIVRRLAPTRITPNQITIGATLLGFVAAGFLFRQHYGVALVLMYLVGWLDGCDGKLARLRLHYSSLGAGESYFDFAYENAWWIALGAGLAEAGHAEAFAWTAALVGGNLLDEIVYTISQAKLGISIDLLSPADGAFRLVAGRRNVYAAMLLVAVLLGSPSGGLKAMGAWAVVTGVVHGLRLVAALRAPQREGLHA